MSRREWSGRIVLPRGVGGGRGAAGRHSQEDLVVRFQSVVVVCAVIAMLAGRSADAQGSGLLVGEGARLASPGLVPVEPNGANAPILRSMVSLDLRDVTLHAALRELSRQMGGRLMFDESVTS